MFCLRIHSVDSPSLEENFTGSPARRRPADSTGEGSCTATSSSRSLNAIPRIEVIRGITHLYRKTPLLSSSISPSPSSSTIPHSCVSLLPADRGTLLFVLAVPNNLSPEDFLRFCGSYADHSSVIHVIRNDGIEDRFSVIVKLDDQKSADAFFLNLNGWRFSSTEGEVCHILYLASVEYTESTEIAGNPPAGAIELPTCPVCIERLDQEITGITSTSCDHSLQCSCISKWANSSCSVCQFCQERPVKPICSLCETSEDLWVCVICGFVGCGRYQEGHAFKHWKDTRHCFSLDLKVQMVWDYVGDSYVHRINQSKSDKSLKVKSHCRASEEHCESCSYSDDSGITGTLLSTKVEAIVEDFSHSLCSELKNQREYYEALLQDAREKREQRISEAVDRAVDSKIQEIQLEIEKVLKEKESLAKINESLLRNQNHLLQKAKEIEQRERETLRMKDQKMQELEEEIRDFTVFIEARKTLGNGSGSGGDDIRGGTLLPVSAPPVSPARSKRSSRNARKRS